MAELNNMRTYDMKADEIIPTFEGAIEDQDDSALAAMVLAFWSEANYYRGKCESMEATVAYLKERVWNLEAREEAARPGGKP